MNAVVVKRYNLRGEAELESGLLKEHGIWSMVRGGDLYAYQGGSGETHLLVKAEDEARAKEVLSIE